MNGSTVVRHSVQYGFKRTDFPSPQSHGAFVILPEKPADGSPWVWYAPTFVTGDRPLPKPLHEWYLRPLLEAGFAVAGVDVGESWGSPAGRTGFNEFYHLVTRQFALSSKACLLPQSRGGLMLYNWAAEHAECVRCIGAIYPVCNIRHPQRLETVCKAYELTSEQLLAQIDRHHPPERLAPLAAAGVPILHIHGDRDEIVLLENNSGDLIRRYQALGGPGELIIVHDKGHEEVPEYFERPELLEFFLHQGASVACGS
ncbi:MAG TPA: prolyl oligopeptidase family serine peptidase [Phycisphaerae bacterium]|nr:prolyl oligopeptidase family serine peptidase [Phycisphaerae bacterium]HOI56584.1 prolyl oligopeptidase family serine peptidase [Phycisphaerae bacterium]